jgi:glycosyltransferase involved in cell wall biosynthesis
LNILFVHLLNNYSGSPQVLATILKELSLRKNYHITLLTSKQDGCLSDIANIGYYNNHYKWSNKKCILLMRFIFAQFFIFFFILIKARKIDIIYINTITPFLAALAGSLVHKKIIYHIHEVYLHPNIIQMIMRITAERYGSHIISVSYYVSTHISRTSTILYNTVARDFEQNAQNLLLDKNIVKYKFSKKNILMISSLKKYKGIDMFVLLAKKCPEYAFSLVVSSSQDDIVRYFSDILLPNNLTIIPQQINLLPYYRDASIVVNLSLPDLWIETFGMTLLEGFYCATPCIAPNFGGPKEIVSNGMNGFLVNPYDEDAIIRAFRSILDIEEIYETFFKNALELKKEYSVDKTIDALIDIIDTV